jgi:HK97 family phage prohead protease
MIIKAFETKYEAKGEGKIEGRASVFGLLDGQGDIVQRGAFTADLAARGNVRPILADHDPTRSIGLGRFAEKSDGLHVSIELAMDLQEARDAFVRVQKGIATGLSIGYSTVQDKILNGARHLLAVELWETSICVFPALSAARVTSAKHGGQELETLLNSLRALTHLNGYNELLEQIRTTRAKHAAIRAIRSGLRP